MNLHWKILFTYCVISYLTLFIYALVIIICNYNFAKMSLITITIGIFTVVVTIVGVIETIKFISKIWRM